MTPLVVSPVLRRSCLWRYARGLLVTPEVVLMWYPPVIRLEEGVNMLRAEMCVGL